MNKKIMQAQLENMKRVRDEAHAELTALNAEVEQVQDGTLTEEEAQEYFVKFQRYSGFWYYTEGIVLGLRIALGEDISVAEFGELQKKH